MAFCIKCGAFMEDDSKFCMMCGTPRDEQPTVEIPAVNPVEEILIAEPVAEQAVTNPIMEEAVEKAAVSLSKESQAEFEPVQAEVPQQAFEPVQPEIPQQGFEPVQPEIPQQGFEPVQSEIPQQGFVPVQSAPQQAYSTQPSYQQPYNAVPAEPRKTKKGPIIACISVGVLAIAAIIVAVVLLLNKGPVEIDLSNYVAIEYEGYNTTGTAYVYVDKSKLLVDILKAQGEDATSTNKVSFSMNALMNSIDVEQTNYTNLTNGEKISITLKYDELLMEENDIEFKNGTKEYTVENLTELTEIDPFKDVTLSFNGTSPNGYVYFNNSSDVDCVRWASMEFDKNEGLKNGDTVTLRIQPKSVDNALQSGYKFSITSKDYKVEGLDFYYGSIDEISDEHMKQYEAEASSTFDDSMSWLSYAEISDKKLLGTYFAKHDGYASNNMIIFVYTATLTSTEGYFDPATIYVPVYLKVSCVEDGKLGYLYGSTDGFMTTKVGYGSYTGYVSGDLMYTEFIVNYLSKNDYEVIATKGMPEFKEVTAENVLPAPGQSGTATDTSTGDTTGNTPTDNAATGEQAVN